MKLKKLPDKTQGMSILQVFALIVIFGIVALIIQSMINSYRANLKRQQLINSRDLIAEMLGDTLINSVAALSYTISKCETDPAKNPDYANFPQNPIFCHCFKKKNCLSTFKSLDASGTADPSVTAYPPNGFPFFLYRSEPQSSPSPIAGGTVNVCNDDSCSVPRSDAHPQYSDHLAASPSSLDDLINGLKNSLLAIKSAAVNTSDFFKTLLPAGSSVSTSTPIQLPVTSESMTRYSAKGERCAQNAGEENQKYIDRCPFSVDLSFKVGGFYGKAAYSFTPHNIQICYQVNHTPSAGEPLLAPAGNQVSGRCTTLTEIMDRAAGRYITPGGSSSSGSSNPGSVPNSSSTGYVTPGSSSSDQSSSSSAATVSDSSQGSSVSLSSSGYSSSAGPGAGVDPGSLTPFPENGFARDDIQSIKSVFAVEQLTGGQRGKSFYVATSGGLYFTDNEGASFQKNATFSANVNPNDSNIVNTGYASTTNVYLGTEKGLYISSEGLSGPYVYKPVSGTACSITSLAVKESEILVNCNLSTTDCVQCASFSTDRGTNFTALVGTANSTKVEIANSSIGSVYITGNATKIMYRNASSAGTITDTTIIPTLLGPQLFTYNGQVYVVKSDNPWGRGALLKQYNLSSGVPVPSGGTNATCSFDCRNAPQWPSFVLSQSSSSFWIFLISSVRFPMAYDSRAILSDPMCDWYPLTCTRTVVFDLIYPYPGPAHNPVIKSIYAIDRGQTNPRIFLGGPDGLFLSDNGLPSTGGSTSMGGFDVIASPNDLPRSDLQYVFASGSFVFVRGISYSTDIGPMIGSPFGMRYSLDGGLSFSNPPLVDDNSFSLPFANDGTNLYYINLRAGRIEVFHSSGFGDSLYHIALPSQFDASSIFADQKYIYAISGSKLVTITKNPLSPNQYLSETREITGLPSYFQHQGGMSSFVVVEGKLFGGCVNGPSGYCSKLYYTNLKDPSASYSSVAIGSGVTKILDIYSSDDYVFIATNNGLYRTSRTLGPSAVPVISPSTSLPQPYVYTVFSKGSSVYVGAGAGADDVSPATAGLYVSTDQGANWTGLMNTNLPSPHINKIHVDGTYIYFATKQGLARGKLLQ